MKTIYEGHSTKDQCIRVLMERWHGATLLDIATDVAAAIYQDDEDVDEDLEALVCPPPDAKGLVPESLLDPDTLLAAVRLIERKAIEQADEDRQLAAAGVRCCLRAGDIRQVADALVVNMQRADADRD